MKYLSKSIVSLGILYFTYKFLMIDLMVAMILGWIVVPIAFGVIYSMFNE